MRKLSCFGLKSGIRILENRLSHPPSRISIVNSHSALWSQHNGCGRFLVKKQQPFFMGSYPVKSGPIQLVNEWEGILFLEMEGGAGRRASVTEIGRMRPGSSPGPSPYITLSDTRKRYLGVCKGRDFMSWSIWKAMGRFIFKVFELLLIKYFEQAHLMRHCRI